MLFPEISPSREHCLNGLAEALQSDGGRVYVDASLLIHCYEMSTSAGNELIAALESFRQRVRVPLWAAKETWEHLGGRSTKLKPLQAPAKLASNGIEKFRLELLRYLDDQTIPNVNRAAFEEQLSGAAATYVGLVNKVANHAPKADLTTAQLLPFIERHRINSDIIGILRVVAETGENRYRHGVPPGCSDGGKLVDPGADGAELEEVPPPRLQGGKKRNRYGDLIIWLEILADCTEAKAEHLVVLTRDTNKGDWAYKPKKFLDGQGRPQANQSGYVTLPQPLLVHEALRACPGLKTVNVASIEMLAHVLLNHLKIPIPALAAAVQSGDPDDGDAAVPEEQKPADLVRDEAGDREVELPLEPVSFGSEDMAYDAAPDDEIDTLILALRLDDWKTQNQAIQRLEPRLQTASRAQLVQIGRCIVDSVNGGAVEPLETLKRVFDSSTSSLLKSHLLVGVLAQVYIDDDGEPRKPIATPGLTELIYRESASEVHRSAVSAVIDRLEGQRRAYLALPGDTSVPIDVELLIEVSTLRGARAFGKALLEEQAPPSRLVNRLGRDAIYTVGELLEELGREFVIPASRLKSEMTDSFTLQLPEFTGYVIWGPNTGATFR